MLIAVAIFLIVGYFAFNEVFVSSNVKKEKGMLLLIVDLLILMVIWVSIEAVMAKHLDSKIGDPKLAAFVVICLLAAFAGYRYKLFSS